jgi:hypothetical protein
LNASPWRSSQLAPKDWAGGSTTINKSAIDVASAIQPVAAISIVDKSDVRRIKEDRLHDRWHELALSSPILRHI